MSSKDRAEIKQDIEWMKSTEHMVRISNRLDLRGYSSTQPHNWKIADLQKGLVLLVDQTEAIGEGVGFGLPVLIGSDETYFSGTSNLHISRQGNTIILRKEFLMNRIARNMFRNIRLENRRARTIIRNLSEAYQKHTRLRGPILALKTAPLKMGLRTAFPESRPNGEITMTYKVRGKQIDVQVDLSRLKKQSSCRIFIMNEQSSTVFRRYFDSNGRSLIDSQIGAWDKVEADWATITDAQTTIGFRLWKIKNSVLRVGREYQKNVLDWIGLDYEVNADCDSFEYEIEIVEHENSG